VGEVGAVLGAAVLEEGEAVGEARAESLLVGMWARRWWASWASRATQVWDARRWRGAPRPLARK
jgi:hypothetical protein